MTAVAIALLGLLGLVVLLGAWGLVEPYLIDEQRHEVAVPGLPEAWRGQRVAFLADLHVGVRFANTPTVARVVRRLLDDPPAVVLIGGDFVYRVGEARQRTADVAARLVAPLPEAGIPTFAVLGNHDYAMPTRQAPRDDALAELVRASLERVGVRVLENEAVPLPVPGAHEGENDTDAALRLVALGARVPGYEDPDRAFADVPEEAARIVMMHHPDGFAAFPPHAAPLVVAGHTHGGQFRIPFTPEWTWMTFTSDDEVHPDGWIVEYGAEGNRLYVNRGIGFSVLPLRLNCPPELTWFTLQAT